MKTIGEYISGWTPFDAKSIRAWGSGYVRNPRRSNQPILPEDRPCALCSWGPSVALSRLRVDGYEYDMIENANPIIEEQLLICPCQHRTYLCERDFALVERLVMEGVEALSPVDVDGHPPCITRQRREQGSRPLACYINTSPAAAQSEPHQHINAADAARLPLPEGHPAVWSVARGIGTTVIARYEGLGYYALTVVGAEADALHRTLEALHTALAGWGMAYNLLAYPEDHNGMRRPRFVVVPRAKTFIEAVGQKLGGFELLTGCLIPSPEHWVEMTEGLRDHVLVEATLDADAALRLERCLRGQFGLPPSGCAIYAIPQNEAGKPAFHPQIETNRSV